MPRRFYSSKYAHDEYRSVLVDCRAGINQTPESIKSMNDLLVPLIKEKHQSIGHIYATHAEELGCPEEHFTPTSMIVYSMSAMVT